MEIHFAERKRRRLPDPEPEQMRIVRDIRRRAAAGIGFPPGETTPD
jgi:hypothetical protein